MLRLLVVACSLCCAEAARSPIVLVGLYNTSTWSGHPIETASYTLPSVFTYNLRSDGTLSPIGRASAGLNVSWLTRHPKHDDLLYAVNEVNEYNGSKTGSVTTLRLDGATGTIAVAGRAATHAAGPVFTTVDSTGRWLLVANYVGGVLTVLPIEADGTVGADAADAQFQGAGSHSVYTKNSGFVLAPVLGADKVDLWRLDPTDGKLTPNPTSSHLSLPAGFGPRHLAFSPTDPSLVLLANEGGAATPSRLTHCAYDSATGVLTALRTLSTLPAGSDPAGLYPAEVLFAPDGGHAYVSVRDATDAKRDAVAIFRIAPHAAGNATAAEVALIGTVHTGHYPRSMALDPSGRLLVVANQKGATVSTYVRDDATGLLTPTGHSATFPDAPGFVLVV